MACAQRCRADVPPRGPSETLASAASLSIPGGSTFEVDVRLLQFVAMVLTALALVPGGANLFALPNKIGLSESDYFITQSVYRSWALLGIVLIGAAIANVALALLIRAQRAPSIFALIGGLCLVATLVIFFVFTFPANQATNNWTQVPADWEQLRWRWELSHAVIAVITIFPFCSAATSLLLNRKGGWAQPVVRPPHHERVFQTAADSLCRLSSR